jgi:hypothetical protein
MFLFISLSRYDCHGTDNQAKKERDKVNELYTGLKKRMEECSGTVTHVFDVHGIKYIEATPDVVCKLTFVHRFSCLVSVLGNLISNQVLP